MAIADVDSTAGRIDECVGKSENLWVGHVISPERWVKQKEELRNEIVKQTERLGDLLRDVRQIAIRNNHMKQIHLTHWICACALWVSISEQVPPILAQDGGGVTDKEADRITAIVVDLISRGADAEYVRKTMEEHFSKSFLDRFPWSQHLGFFRRLHDDLGEPRVAGILVRDGSAIDVMLASSKEGRRLRVEILLEAGPPTMIAGLGIDTDTTEIEPALNDYGELDEALKRRADEGAFSGVVLVQSGNEIQFLGAYGWAEKRSRTANAIDTRFNLGSLNKMFTSVAVLRLFESGDLVLDASINRYLEGFPPEVGERVTVRHLLQHRSGWEHYWDHPEYLARRGELRTVSDYLAFIQKIPLAFEPGSEERYSNVGYEVLGGIVEAVSGRSYYDFIQEHVLDRAGMTGSGCFERDRGLANVAIGYTMETSDGSSDGVERENTSLMAVRGTPAGGCYATAGDMRRFYDALLRDRLLESNTTNLLLNRFDPPTTGMDRRTGQIGLAGGGPGVSAAVELDLATGDLVIVLSNYDPPTAGMTAREIAAMPSKESSRE